MKRIVFDIETKNTFFDVGANDPSLLDISILCIYDSETDVYTSYLEEDFPKLWPILEQADILVGYNSDHFDIPLLNKYYPGDLTHIKSVDIMAEIRKALGRRIGLSHIAKATLNKGKIGHGLEAITWWKKGEIEKLKKYCEEDVRITNELYEYIKQNGKCFYEDGNKKKEIPIDTSEWEVVVEKKLTQTLPF